MSDEVFRDYPMIKQINKELTVALKDQRLASLKKMQREGKTLAAMGEVYGITRERVRQLLEKANTGITQQCIKGKKLKEALDKAQHMYIYEGIPINKITGLLEIRISTSRLGTLLKERGVNIPLDRGLGVPLRRCNHCNLDQPKENFYYRNRAECKSCHSKNQTRLRLERHSHNKFKKMTCRKCGKRKMGSKFAVGYHICKTCINDYTKVWYASKTGKIATP